MKMGKMYDTEFKFIPSTWLLPWDWNSFGEQFKKGKNRTYIVKPEASWQGRGIFLIKNCKNLSRIERYVVQRYIHKPYLMDGFKFDLRIYVLITSVDPLWAYIYKEGMARFAAEKYKVPKSNNLENLYMHLTNYAINKDHEDYEEGDIENKGSKKFLTYILKHIKENDNDSTMWNKIKDIIMKSLIAVQPNLAHSYKSSRPQSTDWSLWFHLLGFDIIIDHKLRPWLLEVNHSPSFKTDSEFDQHLKFNLIRDTIMILGLSVKRKQDYKRK